MTHPNRLKAAAAAAIAGLGGVAAIALTSSPDATPEPAAAPLKRPPVEVRTKVIRRTIHRVKREPAAATGVPSAAPTSPVAAAPAARPTPVLPASAPAPAPAPEPVTTRTSDSSGAGEDDDRFEAEDHEGEHQSFDAEHEDD
jgi:hypothetical protein